MPPHVTNFLLGSFGIVAAILLFGGSILLRWQRARHRYDLLRRAIETGAALPAATPAWLASRQQAVSLLAVGVGLMVVGAGAWHLGAAVEPPRAAVWSARPATLAGAATAPALVPPSATAPALPSAAGGPPLPPPEPSPAVEAWRAAQQRLAVGQTAAGCGLILFLLGAVRLGFSGTERRHEESGPTARL